MKKARIDKHILNSYNDEERYELKMFLKDQRVNKENIHQEDPEGFNDIAEEEAQKQILGFKSNLKHFKNYTRTGLQFLLLSYIMATLFILPVMSKLKSSAFKPDRRSSVFVIQGSLIVFIHCKLLLIDTGLPGITNSQRVTERQSRMIHGLTVILILGLILKNYDSFILNCVYVFPLSIFEGMLISFQYWCYHAEKDIEELVDLNYVGKSF